MPFRKVDIFMQWLAREGAAIRMRQLEINGMQIVVQGFNLRQSQFWIMVVGDVSVLVLDR